MWTCVCGEKIEDGFDTCWSCGRGRVGKIDPEAEKAFEKHKRSVQESRETVGGTRTLKDETISETQRAFIRNAAGHSEEVIEDIKKRLRESDMPLDCKWGVTEVKTAGWISRVRRDFLIVELSEFPDYHNYISVRDFGIYLDCLRVLTIEPGVVKKLLAKKLADDEQALSAPKNILKNQDLEAWKSVVNDCVKQSIDALVERLGQKTSQIRYSEKTILDIW